MQIKHIPLLAVLWLCLGSGAFAGVEGLVFADSNANGVLDPGERGIPDIAVSNGREVLRTDAAGKYAFESVASGFVFVIQPNGWDLPPQDETHPRFYRPVTSEVDHCDFGLISVPEKTSVQALLLADTQTSDEGDVDFLKRSTVQTILATGLQFDFGVTLGDVVNDRLDLLPAIHEALRPIGIPQYYVNGNHDLDFDAENTPDSVASFEALFGPSNFAFECGPALFVGLNDIIYPVDANGRRTYTGGLEPVQFEWLENLLALTPLDQPLVLMVHIPFFQPGVERRDEFRKADKLRLFELLKGRPNVMFLSGHTHYQRHYFHDAADGWGGDAAIHEYNVAAACGSFWSGPLNADGIPVSTMWDGTPPGFGILKVDADGFSTEYFPTNHPADFQIGIYTPEAVPARKGWISFYANVFDGHDGWNIEARTSENAPWKPMRRILASDPSYVAAFLAQGEADAAPLARRLPDPVICFHLWRGYLPGDLDAGTTTLTVRATAPDGRVFLQTHSIEVR
ncbi:calcineurin-like phosphoesterase family protein [Coraliomargarita parva]|uniref:calcineurin-like phosphoesterase family protein n=1 Tax=Coraliomargarita parva TaxID=3014050 RepID=UPI0022B2B2FE|nr:calcineurin-like phosphoesterase family protein [Coraliomargarita parva]